MNCTQFVEYQNINDTYRNNEALLNETTKLCCSKLYNGDVYNMQRNFFFQLLSENQTGVFIVGEAKAFDHMCGCV